MSPQTLKVRLDVALNQPLIHPGSAMLARRFIERFEGCVDWLQVLVSKAGQTLTDGQRHSFAVATEEAPFVAIHAQTWYGTHRECQAARIGNYLAELLSIGRRLTDELGLPLAAILQVDAYVREGEDGEAEADVEYSILPGKLIGVAPQHEGRWPPVLLQNEDFCSDVERHALALRSRVP